MSRGWSLLRESGKNIAGKKMSLQSPMFLSSFFLPPFLVQQTGTSTVALHRSN
jgi:hypothetical protein